MSRLLLTLSLLWSFHAFAATCEPELARPLVGAANRMGLNVLARAFADRPTANALVSPLSLNLALHLALAGAGGETAAELATALGVPVDRIDKHQDALRAAMRDLVDRPGGEQVAIANSAWADQSRWRFHQDFLDRTAADAFARDFADPATKREMSEWISEQTKGKIKGGIDSLSPDVFFVLINALYFKAPWYEDFSPAFTRPRDFTTGAGAVAAVPLMHRPIAHVPYFENDEVQAVTLGFAQVEKTPYGPDTKPSRFTLDLILPRPGRTLAEVLSGLAGSFERVTTGLSEARGAVELAVPKFKLGSDRELLGDLRALGITHLFGEADLSRMGAGPRAQILSVTQRAVAEMDEKGFEAAAVTVLKGGAVSMPRPPQLHFVADRPYVFLLRDRTSGLILFGGVVNDPRNQ